MRIEACNIRAGDVLRIVGRRVRVTSVEHCPARGVTVRAVPTDGMGTFPRAIQARPTDTMTKESGNDDEDTFTGARLRRVAGA